MRVIRAADPVTALREFVDRVSPHDPAPDGDPVAVVEVRSGVGSATFPLSGHLALALASALTGYYDQADRGSCGGCGGRLDENLHCLDCGRLHGVLGDLIAERARLRPAGPAG